MTQVTARKSTTAKVQYAMFKRRRRVKKTKIV